MFKRIQKFFLLGPRQQLLLWRIWLLLGRTRQALLRHGLAYCTTGLARHRTAPVPAYVSPGQQQLANDLARLVAIAARYTPWQSRCLVQVIVLQRLLREHNIPGCFSLGVLRPDGTVEVGVEEGEQEFSAHAWLQCGERIINGATPQRAYVALSTYTWGQSAWE